MEEKERYSYDYFIDGAVFIDTENDRDMDMDTVCSLLNKQDKCIKELEEENKQLKQQLAEKDKEIEILTKQNKALVEEEDLLDKKLKELGVDCIEDLGKSQNQKAIEQLEKVKEFVNEIYGEYSASITTNFIDNQINELKGGEVV